MESEHIKWMKEFERNQRWFIENFEDILKEHREKFVAVWNQRVISADTDLEKLSNNAKKRTRGAKSVYVRYVSEKPIEMIL